jgi:hypothetical protein
MRTMLTTADMFIRALATQAAEQTQLPEQYVNLFINELVERYTVGAQIFDDEPSARNHVYDNELTHKHHAYLLGGWDDGVLLVPDHPDLKARMKLGSTIVRQLQATPHLIPDEQRHVSRAFACFNKLLHNQHLSSRRHVPGNKRETPEYPPVEELRRYHECGRKTVYLTEEDVISDLKHPNSPYKCEHEDHWHQGRAPTRVEALREETAMKRWKLSWRRYNHL